MPEGTKIMGVICKRGASRHNNRPDAYGVHMVRECDRTHLENRENPACHPLDGRRFQKQVSESLEKRKGGVR